MGMSSMLISTETVGLIIDIAVILLIVIYAVRGVLNGFFESVLKAVGTFGALALAIFGAKPLLGLINGVVNISNIFAGMVYNYFAGQDAIFGKVLTETVTDETTQVTTSTALEYIDQSNTFSVLKNFMHNLVENAEMGQKVGDVVSTPIGYIAAVIVVAIVIFILVKFIVFLLSRLFADKEIENGGKSGLDRTLGLFLGTAKGVAIVVGIYFIVSLLTYVPFISNTIRPYINESNVVKPTYQLVENQVNKAIVEQDWNEIIGSILKKDTEEDSDDD